MAERKNEKNNAALTGKGLGPQGIDKKPGEENTRKDINFIPETQKGKNKVDGDPSRQEDRPLDEQDI